MFSFIYLDLLLAPFRFHLPIAYHGRASSIVISGTDIIRPRWVNISSILLFEVQEIYAKTLGLNFSTAKWNCCLLNAWYATSVSIMSSWPNFFLPNWQQLASYPLITSAILVLFRGQDRPVGNSPPYFGPSRKMDFELEMVRYYQIPL